MLWLICHAESATDHICHGGTVATMLLAWKTQGSILVLVVTFQWRWNATGSCILWLWCTLKSSLRKKLPQPSTMTKQRALLPPRVAKVACSPLYNHNHHWATQAGCQTIRMLFSAAFFNGPWKDNGASVHYYKFYKGFARSILVHASSTQLSLQHQLWASGLKKQRGHQKAYATSSNYMMSGALLVCFFLSRHHPILKVTSSVTVCMHKWGQEQNYQMHWHSSASWSSAREPHCYDINAPAPL